MRNLISAIVCGLFALILVSCNKEKDVPVTSVTIGQATAEMLIGETIQLSAKVLPREASDNTVSWASSKQSVATVSNAGLVTAIAEGSSTITASAGGKSGTCTITVSKKVVDVSSVELNKTSAQLKAGETVTLTATVKPDDATDKTVTWSTSDASIATVSNGVVTAKKVGTATITAKAGDKSATCAITVVATPVTSVSLDRTSASLKAGETVTLTATVKPDDATDKTVTWSTSNASVATVENGVVTAIKVGTAAITAEAGDKSASCAISVIPTPVTSITLDQTSAALVVGETLTLSATVKPDDATNKTVTWNSSDESVVTVDASGNLTALNKGKATITVTISDNSSITAICQVVISNPCPEGAVDIGMKTSDGYNLYWAICNLSDEGFVSSPEKLGNYYAWGEIKTKNLFTVKTYKWCNASNNDQNNTLTRYCDLESCGYNGYVDYIYVLLPEDDAAHVILGEKWRMPTREEWIELRDNCYHSYITKNGVNGREFTSKINGNQLFFPDEFYWTSSLKKGGPLWAWGFHIFKNGAWESDTNRINPRLIRAVSDY